ncbi:hypothetical protein [Spartinivicinus poritis]|uniref:Uncharacterized protein n=1 Tax=Spartinivicinus poritis TaxID=2994640 RepID=A0ABT5UFN8_9GAMM|nr:hypothetical protein [Spartinivicinus sp. A2-2]MDE1464278.1 hypothetical protein [Spartinivicinus sp. A2-2]
MNTIIQHIETYWTKESRGYPRAKQRNSVPEAFLMEEFPEVRGVFLSEVKYSEYSNFCNPIVSGLKLINNNQQRQLGFEFEKLGDELMVSMWDNGGYLKKAGLLKKNTWLKVVTNERIPLECTWAYYKHVYNIFFGKGCHVGYVFSTQQPVIIVNVENNLW